MIEQDGSLFEVTYRTVLTEISSGRNATCRFRFRFLFRQPFVENEIFLGDPFGATSGQAPSGGSFLPITALDPRAAAAAPLADPRTRPYACAAVTCYAQFCRGRGVAAWWGDAGGLGSFCQGYWVSQGYSVGLLVGGPAPIPLYMSAPIPANCTHLGAADCVFLSPLPLPTNRPSNALDRTPPRDRIEQNFLAIEQLSSTLVVLAIGEVVEWSVHALARLEAHWTVSRAEQSVASKARRGALCRVVRVLCLCFPCVVSCCGALRSAAAPTSPRRRGSADLSLTGRISPFLSARRSSLRTCSTQRS